MTAVRHGLRLPVGGTSLGTRAVAESRTLALAIRTRPTLKAWIHEYLQDKFVSVPIFGAGDVFFSVLVEPSLALLVELARQPINGNSPPTSDRCPLYPFVRPESRGRRVRHWINRSSYPGP